MVGLTLLLALQELHVIIVKHQAANDDAAGSYAVAAVAGKAIMWIAIGLGLYLLPEASRRAKIGEDARPILLRTLGLIAAMAVPAMLIYSVAGEPLLRIVFGDDLTEASDALPFLGLAMSLLACSYLSVQYLLAMGRAHFLLVLAAGVVVEVPVLLVDWRRPDRDRDRAAGDPGCLRGDDPDHGDAAEAAYRRGLRGSNRRPGGRGRGSPRTAAAAA